MAGLEFMGRQGGAVVLMGRNVLFSRGRQRVDGGVAIDYVSTKTIMQNICSCWTLILGRTKSIVSLPLFVYISFRFLLLPVIDSFLLSESSFT